VGHYIFCRWQSKRSSVNFRTVFSESQNANPLDAELETDFNAKWPFKVIHFGVNEEPLRGYIVQYNNCGLECEGSEDVASERSENRHLRRPHSHLTPANSPANPSDYPHKSYLARYSQSLPEEECPSVHPSHSGIVSKWRKLASWFLHHPRARTF